MRRSLAAVAVALSLSVSVAAGPPSIADESRPEVGPADARATPARAVLLHADAVLDGTTGARVSPTLALRDLFVELPSLVAQDRKQALGLLARPTQGADDPNGDGYTVPAKKDCSAHICLHWVPTTADAPPSRKWVSRTMAVMKETWSREVGRLGYRPPVRDGARGGNEKFDVYLKDVGANGYYGYCAPERRKAGSKWLASGYCVLDDDFARSQFRAKPTASLRVTAAHEFFHAVQFAYDYGEDRWLMESSATWMEERVADDVNDNRQYLRHGQLVEPGDPLDLFNPSDFDQYGNWVFFEYLSGRFGVPVVRRIWDRAGAHPGAPDRYSIRAVKESLPRRHSWLEVFRAYAAANTMPRRSYPEGHSWPDSPARSTRTLTAGAPTSSGGVRIDHLAARSVVIKPGDGLRRPAWRLTVNVDGPAHRVRPAAYVIVHLEDGSVDTAAIRLDRDGRGQKSFRFGGRAVSKVTLTLANASTRYNCWEQDPTYACQGRPLDDDRRFAWAVRAFKN